MSVSRRSFLASMGAASFGSIVSRAAPNADLRIGIMDTSLRLAGKAEAVGVAAKLGFAGIQVTLGSTPEGRLRFGDAALQKEYVAALRVHKMNLASTYIDILHRSCLKQDPAAPQRVAEGIEATRKLGAPILMLVFFGKCALSSDSELDAVADRLKELAPLAEKAGIVLGFENTVSAAQNERVLDRVGSQALKVYYDIGNATNLSGFDAPAEIRRLGAARICQFHIKDKGYLGEGKVDVEASMRAMAEIGFRGFGMLETAVLTTPEEDARRNLVYAREAWRKASNA